MKQRHPCLETPGPRPTSRPRDRANPGQTPHEHPFLEPALCVELPTVGPCGEKDGKGIVNSSLFPRGLRPWRTPSAGPAIMPPTLAFTADRAPRPSWPRPSIPSSVDAGKSKVAKVSDVLQEPARLTILMSAHMNAEFRPQSAFRPEYPKQPLPNPEKLATGSYHSRSAHRTL